MLNTDVPRTDAKPEVAWVLAVHASVGPNRGGIEPLIASRRRVEAVDFYRPICPHCGEYLREPAMEAAP